jgi:cytochrome c oxidase assembly protein subunit 15
MLAMNAALGLVFAQASMGIGCLLYQVPVSLGAAHQLGSVFLLSTTTWLAHELRKGNIQKVIRKIPK